jgi:hypothetical protein
MQTETSLGAVFKTLRTLLLAGTPLWAARVFMNIAPLGTTYPYVIYAHTGGGELSLARTPSDEHVIMVRAVSDVYSTAEIAALQIKERLNDRGAADYRAEALPSYGWEISTITGEEEYAVTETTQEGRLIHHRGQYFRVFCGGITT